MDGALFPHKPPYPIQSKRPPPPPQSTTQSLKFSSATLHLPPPNPPSFPLDSLLHHLVHLSSTPRHTNSAARFVKSVKPISSSVLGTEEANGSLKLLCKNEIDHLINHMLKIDMQALRTRKRRTQTSGQGSLGLILRRTKHVPSRRGLPHGHRNKFRTVSIGRRKVLVVDLVRNRVHRVGVLI